MRQLLADAGNTFIAQELGTAASSKVIALLSTMALFAQDLMVNQVE